MIEFQGKTVVITGAAGGIGHAAARQMLGAGAVVVLADNNRPGVERAARELDPEGKRTLVRQFDITSSAAAVELFADVASRCGSVDHIIHCAGIYQQKMVADCTDDEWRTLMSINVDGTFFLCRAAIPYLKQGSSIVLCASGAGHKGSRGHAAYAASKGAVLAFMRSLALELAPDVRVNAVSPGIIATAMTKDLISEQGGFLLSSTPMGRYGDPAEVASAAVFLCSPLASFITGETILINGGMYMA
jgi:3-oxoacyl-[acyl-carrier protein] reductase